MIKNNTNRNHLSSVVGAIILGCSLGWSPASAQAAPLPCSLRDLHHTPSPYECAVLSAHVYQENLQQGDHVLVRSEQGNDTHTLHGWIVYKVFQEYPSKKNKQKKQFPDGYKGVLYCNRSKQQCVLVHRGTVPNLGALKTDALSIAQNIIAGQEKLLLKVLQQAVTIAEKETCSLTVTGHSLGGWLAQLTAFIAQDKKQYRSKLHLNAITFDSPGARPMLEQMNPQNDAIHLDQLDITNYLSAPNLINACNPHVGTLYRVVFDNFNATPRHYTLASHAMHNFLHAFDPTTGKEQRCVFMKSWPLISKESFKKMRQGLTKMLQGQLIETMGNFLAVLKIASDGELLGQYSGFFRFAQKTNHYHPDGMSLEEDSQDDFELKYKYHYHTEPFDPSAVANRHLPTPVQRFITNLRQGRSEVSGTIDQEKEFYGLDWDPLRGILSSSLAEDIRPRVDRLVTIALQHPDLFENTAPLGPPRPTEGRARIRMPLAPPSISFFVSRKMPLAQLSKAYQNQSKRIVHLLTGPGGMGKSQLALKFYHTVQEEYVHTFWLSAETTEKLTSAYLEMAEALGIYYIDKKQVEKTIQKVRMRLADQFCLYVFDNAPSYEEIKEFLPLNQGHVLITSRNSAPDAWGHATQQLLVKPFLRTKSLSWLKTLTAL